ncbi:MAG TPA: hypothetical protein DCQ98_17305 [Planctomycetaceae bacterium]|nr:hypothetical protein [Planctomycetaceae bacterium]HRF02586.1 hypothetical protein [Pirellulaceae bacterium]
MRRLMTMLMLAGVLAVTAMPVHASAGILDRLFGRGTTRSMVPVRVDSGRRFSYEPGASAGSAAATRSSSSSTPRYLMQKSDPNKYRVN